MIFKNTDLPIHTGASVALERAPGHGWQHWRVERMNSNQLLSQALFPYIHPPSQPVSFTAPAASSASIPLPTHKGLKPRLKVMHWWYRTWHLLCSAGLGFGGRGNHRDVMRGQRWIRYFIMWKRRLLPQRLQSKQTRKKLLFLQLTSVRTCSLPPPSLNLPCFNSSELLPSCSSFNKWVVLSKLQAKTYWDYSRRERLTGYSEMRNVVWLSRLHPHKNTADSFYMFCILQWWGKSITAEVNDVS